MTDQSIPVGGPSLPQRLNLVTEIPGPKSRALQARKEAAVSAGVGVMLPAYAVAAGGGVIVDVDGNSLIDFASGIAVTGVGNSAPEVVEAVQKQVAQFTHTSFATVPYEGYVEVCERLNKLTPGDFEKRTALFNSGSEAVENAVKFARNYTGKDAIVAFDHAFHGRTNLTMGLTAKAMPYKRHFGPFANELYRVPGSYPYRDGLTGPEAAKRTISMIETQIGADSVAAILLEPIQGEGGFIVPAEGYIPALVQWAHENDVLFIADEVQAGIARTGRMFAMEYEGVVADLVTTAKAIGGGLPLSAVTGRAEIMDHPQAGGIGGTYGGNPAAVAASAATLDKVVREDLASQALHIGEIITKRMTELQQADPRVGEVRGRGAMQAIEIVDPATREPDAELTAKVADYAHKHGVVVLTAGTYGNVIRFLTPLVISDELLEQGLAIIADGFKAN
ncbi:4-aminobutyrate--2-oxoglutarate transaminase [Pseudoclavibacter caeni]|jgi:4-aminobutyrate aminotransferase / (S)-3-amino-2-methylpropionate transaminase / 5-aminovalerate transaminase|uniref:(S)-3-amino-2-methylpropionate transaminase n=1 Tax=Pseudoclavibacter caeni TaxID=908846 RepID=A0A7C8FU77_9MICO|nr:4-aminobutyrate--2-oxoglutarate transaminase [Pseudoclavibacter caeni]KAB1632355.1 4-aminobutyrate--2-oxoglutarate transaminase [Pseudoclavibacter caeni]NYJ97596.1 4-aminobutyrate aminotransferase/(S)-3-amino-2-methylpropionate transaminase [Pseudoclavibacter caeni]